MDATEQAAWRTADRLFAELLDLDPAARKLRLRTLVVDELVRERLASLLACSEQDHDWLDHDDSDPLRWAVTAPAHALLGRRFGAWEIESELGRGGMAVVYRAHRADGAVEQVAALKLLTSGTLGRDGAERFRRETDILARLDHPNIVGLLDAGVADDGTPWLVMPLIEGPRIDDWCRAHDSDTRQVATLFLQVCAAVDNAHRSLIIHRDLKPSNVLVDRNGQVRLLDFGIARLVDQPDEATATHWRALTPDYAAPEQFQGQSPSTAMDIYGLGALLYRLLAGRAPRQSSQGDTITRPSLVAAQQPADARRHRRALHSDLDRVLLKALAADPAQRYGTVEALAADLQCWLDGRPTRAAAPGRGYRLRKFVARHRIGVAVSVAMLLLLSGGITATLWQAERARNQAERALAVRDLLIDVLQASDPTVTAGADPPASELLRRGADQVREKLADRPELLAELLMVIGRSQINRARLDDAQASLDDALALHDAGAVGDPALHAETLSERAQLSYEQGRTGVAIERARAAAAIAAVHGPRDLHLRIQVRLADLLMSNRQTEEASTLARSVIERIEADGIQQPRSDHYYRALLVLGTVAEIAGDQAEAVVLLERAADGFRDREDGLRTLANIENTLGVTHLNAGRFDDAERALRSALAAQTQLFGTDHPGTLVARSNLAGVLMFSGEPAAAAAEFERLLLLQRAAVGVRPNPDIARLEGYLARARYLSGDTVGALAAAESGHAELLGVEVTDRAGLDWIAPLAGLLRLEQQVPDPDRLLANAVLECSSLEQKPAVRRWLCLAQALDASDRGSCRLSDAQPPAPDDLEGIDRRWWAVYWLLASQCTRVEPDRAVSAITALAAGAQPPFPHWLQNRIATQVDARPRR